MGIIKKYLQKVIYIRYDEDGAIPYYRCSDFLGLNVSEESFVNSKGVEVHYFFYNYDNYRNDKIVLVCHGLGPGHSAYLAEIEVLCKAGYKVLTLDYSGCGYSKGERMNSMNSPTRDVIELLNHLDLKKEIVLFGHSLGAYTSINVLNVRSDIKKAVVISGFISVKNEIASYTKSKLAGALVKRYEKRQDKEFGNLDNISFLKNTTDKILYIHSLDDQMVPYSVGLGEVLSYNNENIECITVDGKKHNPNYTVDAVKYMYEVFNEYRKLIKNKTLDTLDKRKEFMSDKSIKKMTEQDMDIMNKIISFID